MGHETRRKLIEAGIVLFGLHGLDATGTRALAQEAGVNLASIPYHFGGKEGLYLAVLQHIVELKMQEIGPCLERVRADCDDPSTGRDTLLEHLRTMIRMLVAAAIKDPKARSCSQIMLQEQIAPTAGFHLFHEGFILKLHAAWNSLLSRLTGLPLDSRELHLRTMSVIGQMFIFRIGMPSLLRFMDSDHLSEADLEAITGICLQQTEALVAHFSPVCAGGTR